MRQQISAPWKNFLSLDIQSGARCDRRQEVRDALFSGTTVARREKGRIDAWKSYQLAKQFDAGNDHCAPG